MSVKRPDLILGAAVLVSLPMVPGILDGAISTTAALERFLIGLVICWVGGSLLGSVNTKYTLQSRRQDILRAIEAARRPAESSADEDKHET